MSRPVQDWAPRGLPDMEDRALIAVGSPYNTLVVAGPGAGKTELLAQRASFLLETNECSSPHRILAISFKRDAAHNLRERVIKRCGTELAQRFDSHTYSGWAKGLLDRFRLALPVNYRPTSDYIIDNSLGYGTSLRKYLLPLCEEAGVDRNRLDITGHENNYNLVRSNNKQLEGWYKQAILENAINNEFIFAKGTVRSLFNLWWQSVLFSGSSSLLNFTMIETLSELLLRTNPSITSALRSTYTHVFLDEFQDTTQNQYRLLETAFKDSKSILTAVGDNKQRIMLWAGADIKAFDLFTSSFQAELLRLEMNYRSAPKLVAIQWYLIKALDPKSVKPRPASIHDINQGECRILSFTDYKSEASYIAKSIKHWVEVDKISKNDICLIVRQKSTNYVSEIQDSLDALGINSRIQNELQDLVVEPLSVIVTDMFRLCLSNKSWQSWHNASALLLKLHGICDIEENTIKSHKSIEILNKFINQLRPKFASSKSQEEILIIIHEILAFLDENLFCQFHEQYLQASFLHQVAEECARFLAISRNKFSSWDLALDNFLGIDSIPIMTIHKSKGLEYHTVVFIGLEDKPFFGYDEGNGSEEDCNLFVAFSRAKTRVLFTFAEKRPDKYGTLRQQNRNSVSSIYTTLKDAGVDIEYITT